MFSLAMLLGAMPAQLPPVANLPYQTQPRRINEECMHVGLVNALRAIEFQATGKDPGPLSVQFVGLAADEEYDVITSPDQAFGTSGAGEIGRKYGACLAARCPETATAISPEARENGQLHRCVDYRICGSWKECEDWFARGPCAIAVNLNGHAYTIVARSAEGGAIVVDPFPSFFTGQAPVKVWSRSYCEKTIKRLGGANVAALIGFGGQ